MSDVIVVSRTGSIAAPAAAVWATIADFGTAHLQFASVVECVVVGEGIGARRHLRTDTGGTTVSELTELDHEAMAMGYRIVESTVPVEEYTSRFVVQATPSGCDVVYTSRFLPRGVTDRAEIEQFLADQLDSAIDGLRTLHE